MFLPARCWAGKIKGKIIYCRLCDELLKCRRPASTHFHHLLFRCNVTHIADIKFDKYRIVIFYNWLFNLNGLTLHYKDIILFIDICMGCPKGHNLLTPSCICYILYFFKTCNQYIRHLNWIKCQNKTCFCNICYYLIYPLHDFYIAKKQANIVCCWWFWPFRI